MDYKDIYLQKYESTFQLKEDWVKEQLIKYKNEERTYISAEQKITEILKKEYWAFGPDDKPNFYFNIGETCDKLIKLHKNNGLNKILRNEIKDLYEENDKLSFDSYESFIQSFATYKAIFDVYIFYGRMWGLVKAYYDLDELYRFKLEPVDHYKKHSDYNRLIKSKFPNYPKTIREQIKFDQFGEFVLPEKNTKRKEVPTHINNSSRLLSEEKFLLLDLFYSLISDSSEKNKDEANSSEKKKQESTEKINSVFSDMKKAEFARLMILTQDALDPNLLELPSDKFSSNLSYNHFKDNIELKPRNVQIDIIASLEAKLEKFHLPRTKAALKNRLRKVKTKPS